MATFCVVLPTFNVATWTCPKDAAATGSSSKSAKISDTSFTFSSSATICFARAPENAGTSSCNDFKTSTYSFSTTSVLVERTCPNFTNVGPNCSNESRAKTAAAVFSSLVLAFNTLKTHSASFRQTPKLRRSELRWPTCSHPASNKSPSPSKEDAGSSSLAVNSTNRRSRDRIDSFSSQSAGGASTSQVSSTSESVIRSANSSRFCGGIATVADSFVVLRGNDTSATAHRGTHDATSQRHLIAASIDRVLSSLSIFKGQHLRRK
mmetsp:Transcript_22532/g.72493  ORF Transcript_22532/g.72493 Transcript_22532/m.72493 type:complete len:264 (-) Transcript_22532:2-793(-)